MDSFEKWINESARKLDRLEKEYMKLMYESGEPTTNEELLKHVTELRNVGADAFDIRNEILVEFPHITNLKIYDSLVKNILKKIREKEKFYSINFYECYSEFVEEKSGKPFDFPINFEQFMDAKFDDWWDDFHSNYHIPSYYGEIIKIGPIISSASIPDEARSYFSEIREAYAFALYFSAIALCRALMEMCIFDKLSRKGAFQESNIVQFDTAKQDRLYHLIPLARNKGLLNDRTKNLAGRIRRSSNRILHPRKINKSELRDIKKDALEIIIGTIGVIEKLYT